MEVNIGDEIEYEIHYKNTTDSKAESIAFKFIEPEELDFVEGTAMLYNESNPDGLVLDVDEDAIIKQGVAIGGYEVNGDGYVRAKFVVNDSDEFTSKKNTLRMWGQIDDGNLTLEDSADIILYMN